MKKIYFLLILSIITFCSLVINDIQKSKAYTNYERCDEIYAFVFEMPRYKGDNTGAMFRNYIQSKIKYPENARKNGISETIFVQYVVDKKGYIGDINVIRGENEELKAAALAAFENAPKFDIPGKNNGIPVCVRLNMPITFRLK